MLTLHLIRGMAQIPWCLADCLPMTDPLLWLNTKQQPRKALLCYFTTVYSVRPHFHMRKESICSSTLTASLINFPFWFYSQTLQMGIKHFSGLFVMLCVGFGLSILTTIGEHIVYRLVLPRIKKKSKMKYWLHTSQVRVLKEPCERLAD